MPIETTAEAMGAVAMRRGAHPSQAKRPTVPPINNTTQSTLSLGAAVVADQQMQQTIDSLVFDDM